MAKQSTKDDAAPMSLEETRKENHVKPGSPEHLNLLAAGYPGMTPESAKAMIAERKQDPALWPLEEVRKAEAYLAAIKAKPKAISKSTPWIYKKRR